MYSYIRIPTKCLTPELEELFNRDGYSIQYMSNWGYHSFLDHTKVTTFDKYTTSWGLPDVIDHLWKNNIPFDHDFEINGHCLNYKDYRYRPGSDSEWTRCHDNDGFEFDYHNYIAREFMHFGWVIEQKVKTGELSAQGFLDYVQRSLDTCIAPPLEDYHET